jgi:hypothetical protein
MIEYRVTCNRVENGVIVVKGPTWRVDSYEDAESQISAYYENGLNNDCTFLIEARQVTDWSAVGAWTIGTYLDGGDEDYGK